MDLSNLRGDTNNPLRLSGSGGRLTISHKRGGAEVVGHFAEMKKPEFKVPAAGDPRLAVHATSPLPAWLWSTDGTRVLWANPIAARLFGASSGTTLSARVFGPADRHRRQVAQLAHRLLPNSAIRMERLRGFGAALGALVTCACARLDFADGEEAILIVAAEPVGRPMPLLERLQRLVDQAEEPVAAFETDGHFVAASPAAGPLLGFHTLADAGLEETRLAALKEGHAEATLGSGQVVLQRVGSRPDLGILAFITPAETQASPVEAPDAASELPAAKDGSPNTPDDSVDALRSQDFFNDPPSADMMLSEIGPAPAAASPNIESLGSSIGPPVLSAETSSRELETAQPTHLETPVDTPEQMPNPVPPNVIPFRPPGEPPQPVLTPVENSAFNELARQLSARLEVERGANAASEPPCAAELPGELPPPARSVEPPTWLGEPAEPARGESGRDKALFDLLPTGILIYRLDRLLYANRAFLDRVGCENLHALEHEGGLDALYVEPGVSGASSASDTGTPVTISAPQPHGAGEAAPGAAVEARLHTISWDGDPAHALIFSSAPADTASPAAAASPPPPAAQASAVGHANAEELAAILDTTADGILMFDAEGNINSANRSAEALFGYDGAELVQRNFSVLFAPESQAVANQYLESLKGGGVASLLEHGREVLGRVRGGGLIPLSLTIGRTQAQGPNFFAVFRDLSQSKKSESELREARRLAERAAHAKADLLARISHEIRTPLNAIIGFAEVMIGERFGALGNERYVEYMKDVRASGERVIAVIDDLTNLSRIETGKLDLAFTNQNLNDIVESCVAVMQPQANRERIIIRTSLAHALPPVVADALALRQIAMNLIGNSIHLANAGGQVIVSTALTDLGHVALRVRDTGQGLNDNEVAAAMEPFRNAVPPDQAPESGVTLSLTKALVEANRAQFNIKTAAHSGTLVEVVFPHTLAKART